MITITENRTHIMQMKDDYKIAEVKKTEIVDFGVDLTCETPKIVFKVKSKSATIETDIDMHFNHGADLDAAIADVIFITDKLGI
jgi:hypothetical protein